MGTGHHALGINGAGDSLPQFDVAQGMALSAVKGQVIGGAVGSGQDIVAVLWRAILIPEQSDIGAGNAGRHICLTGQQGIAALSGLGLNNELDLLGLPGIGVAAQRGIGLPVVLHSPPVPMGFWACSPSVWDS